MKVISNERLEELIKSDVLVFCSPTNATVPELQSCLAELKRYRQAATAGVEEAAEKISERVYDCSDGLRSHEMPEVKRVIVAELTALLAPYVAVLRECREYVDDVRQGVVFGGFAMSAAGTLLARIDALTKGGGDGKNAV